MDEVYLCAAHIKQKSAGKYLSNAFIVININRNLIEIEIVYSNASQIVHLAI